MQNIPQSRQEKSSVPLLSGFSLLDCCRRGWKREARIGCQQEPCETTKSEMKKETAHSPVAAIFALFCLSLQLEGRDFFCSYKQTQILPRQAHTLCFKYRQHSNSQTFGTDCGKSDSSNQRLGNVSLIIGLDFFGKQIEVVSTNLCCPKCLFPVPMTH